MKTWFFFPLHHCNMLTTSGTKPLWQRDKAGAKVFLAEKKQALKIDPANPQSDHTFSLREHFHSNLCRHTLQKPLFPKYICLLCWRAVIPGREICYCEWNLFRSLLSLSGKVCTDTAMGGSINFRNTESCAQECLAEPVGRGSCAVPVPAAPSPAARQGTRGCGNAAARCLPLETHPGGQAGKEMWWMPLIPHTFQTSKMGLWKASSVLFDTAERNWII